MLHFAQLDADFIGLSSIEPDKESQDFKAVSKARTRDQFGKVKKRFLKLYKSKQWESQVRLITPLLLFSLTLNACLMSL